MDNKQPKNPSSSVAEEMAGCRVCCEPMKAHAIKCTKCGSYQDWTRHLLRWSTLLVSLFALAPLWSIADSLSRLAFSEKAAKLEAVLTSCSQNEVRLVFENSGNTSSIITGVNFILLQDGKRVTLPDLEIRSNQGGEDIVVSPNQPLVKVSYRPSIGNVEASFISESQARKDCFYLLEIDWVDLAGSEQRLKRKCRCP